MEVDFGKDWQIREVAGGAEPSKNVIKKWVIKLVINGKIETNDTEYDMIEANQ